MQIRKLVKSGTASYTIALPKTWINKNKLKKGDLLYVDEITPEKLSISTEYMEEPEERKEAIIQIDKKGENQIYREITGEYLDNYFRIIIKGKELNKSIDLIRQRIHDLVALEIVEESSEQVVARSFLNLKDVSIKGLIRRIDNIIKAMISDAKSCIFGPDTSSIIHDRDYEVNRLTFLIFKILKNAIKRPKIAKTLDINALEILKFWSLTVHLEKIADESKRVSALIAELNKTNKRVNKKSLEKLFIQVEEHYSIIMKALYQNNLVLADEESSKRPGLVKKCTEYFEKNKHVLVSEITGKFKGMLSHIDDISRLTRYLS